MKFKGLIVLIALMGAASACSQNAVQNLKVGNDVDSLAYAIGILNQVSASQSEVDIDPLMMAKGMQDMKDGKAIMNETSARGYVTMYMRKQQEDRARREHQEDIEVGQAFLSENKEKEGVIVTESGLQYKVLVMGEGPIPTATDRVRVHYTGTLIDGTQFNSSYDNNQPAEFSLDEVISGWTEGIQLMPVGSKFIFYIPYELAYGSNGAGSAIAPFSTLIFEIDLLDIITE